MNLSDSEVIQIQDFLRSRDPKSWSYLESLNQKNEWTPRQNPRVVTASALVNPLDDLILVSGATTMTLETAVGCDGRRHTLFKTDSANTMTIACNGSQTINGAATFAATAQYTSVIVESNGTNWNIIASGGPITNLGVATATSINFGGGALSSYVPPTAWAPTGNGVTLTVNTAGYVRIGSLMIAAFDVLWPATIDGGAAEIKSLPVANGSFSCGVLFGYTDYGAAFTGLIVPSATKITLYALTGVALTNVTISGKEFAGVAVYLTA